MIISGILQLISYLRHIALDEITTISNNITLYIAYITQELQSAQDTIIKPFKNLIKDHLDID